MTSEEMAGDMQRAFCATPIEHGRTKWPQDIATEAECLPCLAAALARARAEGLEAAAVICDAVDLEFLRGAGMGMAHTAAQRIRALVEAQQTARPKAP